MSPLLALQAQVDFTGLAPRGCPLPDTWGMAIGALAGVTEGDMAGFEPDAFMVSQPLLPMESLLTAQALEATTLITLKDGRISPVAGIAFLAHQAEVQDLLRWGSLGTHIQTEKEVTDYVLVSKLSQK